MSVLDTVTAPCCFIQLDILQEEFMKLEDYGIGQPTELIILGNGFDLACGLKSSYTDFFNSYLSQEVQLNLETSYQKFCKIQNLRLTKEEEEQFNSRIEYIPEIAVKNTGKFTNFKLAEEDFKKNILEFNEFQDLNLFDIFFFLKSSKKDVSPDWSNIELTIQLFLTQELLDAAKDNLTCINSIRKSLSEVDWNIYNRDTMFLIECMELWNRALKIETLEKQILNELHLFEKKFKQYLFLQNESFSIKNIVSTLSKIIDKREPPARFLDSWDSYGIRTGTVFSTVNILTFNYTNKFSEWQSAKEEFIANIQNVHGTLDTEIVFGVDEIAIDADNNLYSFTKTSRMMNNTSYDANSTPILHLNIKKIKFYGHSLSEMDYSYFQSIFDFYDLYGSDVQLFFYYSIYNETIAEDIKSNQLQAITKMIHKYGATMNNKDHGRNLQHKLLLEKRIHIICI